jgi:hypothetical protein
MDVPKEFKESLDKEQEELKNLSPEELAALNDKMVAAMFPNKEFNQEYVNALKKCYGTKP